MNNKLDYLDKIFEKLCGELLCLALVLKSTYFTSIFDICQKKKLSSIELDVKRSRLTIEVALNLYYILKIPYKISLCLALVLKPLNFTNISNI